jgi:hypothetical protein
MAFSVKNDVFHQILVYFSKYIIKLFRILTNFIIGINLKKLLINMKFVLWAIFSGKDQNQFFSPSVDCRATVHPYNDFKSRLRVINLVVESNVLSKSVLELKSVKSLSRYRYYVITKPARSHFLEISEKKNVFIV